MQQEVNDLGVPRRSLPAPAFFGLRAATARLDRTNFVDGCSLPSSRWQCRAAAIIVGLPGISEVRSVRTSQQWQQKFAAISH